jgi:GST-like protein
MAVPEPEALVPGDGRPPRRGARKVGSDHAFKQKMDEDAKHAMFPSNYPKVA